MVIVRKEKPKVGYMRVIDKRFLLIPRWTDKKIAWLCPARLVYRRERTVSFTDAIKGPAYDEVWVLVSIFTGPEIKERMNSKKAEDN